MSQFAEGQAVFSIVSLQACEDFAKKIAELARAPLVIALVGTLGAGKTQWTRFFVVALGGQAEDVTSPTFVLVHRYETAPTIYHLDAYRLSDEDEFYELGIEEMFQSDAITIIEWADRVRDCLPRDHLRIQWEVIDETVRTATVTAAGPHSQSILVALKNWQPADLGTRTL